MDEMTIDRELRDFRAAAPGVEPSVEIKIHGMIAAAPMDRTRPSRRMMWSVAVSAAAVVGVVAAAGVLHTGSDPQPSGPGVLDGVASAVAAQPAPDKPRDDQWVFVESASSQLGGPSGAVHPSWVRFDGKQEAFYDPDEDPQGPLHIQDLLGDHAPRAWYAEAADLPEDPEALLAQLRSSRLTEENGSTRAERDYDGVVTFLTFGMPLPPSAQARLLEALGTIPGVGFDQNAAPDLVGHPVLSVTFTSGPDPQHPTLINFRYKRELLLDPQTYAVRGTRMTALEDAPSRGKTGPVTKGEIWTADTIVSVGVVDAPGYLP